jgi:hypothetical protein
MLTEDLLSVESDGTELQMGPYTHDVDLLIRH